MDYIYSLCSLWLPHFMMTIAILAGGEGSRMGRPKGELRIGDVPILAYLHERLRPCGRMILITAPGREHPQGTEKFDAEFADPVAGLGPIRGVLTALENSASDIVVITSVDMPLVSAEQIEWLADELSRRPEKLGMLLARGAQVEPFPSIFRTSAATVLRERMEAKRLSVRALLEDERFALVDAPSQWDERVWTNLNTLADFEAFLRG